MEFVIALVGVAAVIGFVVYRLNRKVEATRPSGPGRPRPDVDRNEP